MESFTEPQVTSEEQAASNVKRTHEDDEPLSSNKKAKTDAVMAGAHLSDTIFARYLETCNITVGPQQVSFTVHTKVLDEQCPQLHQRLRTTHSCSGMQPYHLQTVSPTTFKIFCAWLYSGRITASGPIGESVALCSRLVQGLQPEHATSEQDDSGAREVGDLELVELYQLGVANSVPDLSDAALFRLASQNECQQCTSAYNAVDRAFDSTYTNPKLCAFMVEEASRRLNAGNVPKYIVQYPGDYVQRVLHKKLGKNGGEFDRLSTAQWSSLVCIRHFIGTSKAPGIGQNQCQFVDGGSVVKEDISNHLGTIETVVVGFEEVPFPVHEDLICRHSHYFRGAFKGGFSEATEGTVVLKQESVRDFALFTAWLYSGKIQIPTSTELECYDRYERQVQRKLEDAATSPRVQPCGDEGDESDDDDDDNDDDDDESDDSDEDSDDSDNEPALAHEARRLEVDAIQNILVDLFIFADRREVPGLRNDIIDLLAEQRESGWPLLSASVERVGIAFSSLPSNSKLCRYLIDEAAFCWDDQFGGLWQLREYPSVFTAQVMEYMLRYSQNKDECYMPDWRNDICSLYDHADKEGDRCEQAHEAWYKKMNGKESEMEPVKPEWRVASA